MFDAGRHGTLAMPSKYGDFIFYDNVRTVTFQQTLLSTGAWEAAASTAAQNTWDSLARISFRASLVGVWPDGQL